MNMKKKSELLIFESSRNKTKLKKMNKQKVPNLHLKSVGVYIHIYIYT